MPVNSTSAPVADFSDNNTNESAPDLTAVARSSISTIVYVSGSGEPIFAGLPNPVFKLAPLAVLEVSLL